MKKSEYIKFIPIMGRKWSRFPKIYQQALSGNEKAQMELARRYMEGRGVAKDRQKAVEIYRKLIGNGNFDAMVKLADYAYYIGLDSVSYEEMTFLYLTAACNGHLKGMRIINYYYRWGLGTLNQDAYMEFWWDQAMYDEGHLFDDQHKCITSSLHWWFMGAWKNIGRYKYFSFPIPIMESAVRNLAKIGSTYNYQKALNMHRENWKQSNGRTERVKKVWPILLGAYARRGSGIIELPLDIVIIICQKIVGPRVEIHDHVYEYSFA